MKTHCQECGGRLTEDGVAYVCCYQCTFCATCAARHTKTCPHCGNELVPRAKRNRVESAIAVPAQAGWAVGDWKIWLASAAIWTFVALAGTFTIWQLYRGTDKPMHFLTTMALQMSQTLMYIPLTPFAFAFAIRYPLNRNTWKRRWLLYLGAGLMFSLVHILLRAATPYAIWDSKQGHWVSALWDSDLHVVHIRWLGLRNLFFTNVVDDITGTFGPIVLIAHAISYYRQYRDREVRASQLESQLAKAHLHSLKSQLQPHFLFNTMHSISALMLTNVEAADRMITRLADLLRMNLESAGTQITTLSRELDFVNCYLEIEKVRFEERLTSVFDIEPETLDAQVPLLILQPLVDNAVKHGIARMAKGGEIRITAYLEDGDLKLEVRDNGPGLEESSPARGSGLGLKLTRERLEVLYGENQSVEVTCPAEGGVSVLVSIPFRPTREADGKATATESAREELQTRYA